MLKKHFTRFVPQRIIRGGKDFDYCPLDGDIPLLQFVNTRNKNYTFPVKKYLHNYNEFLIWSVDIGIIDEDMYEILELEARCYAKEAESMLDRVLMDRDNFYMLLDCFTRNEPVYPLVIKDLNHAADEARKHLSYVMTPNGLSQIWINTQEELGFPLWAITASALHFLTTVDVKYIKLCRCGNFYLDTTKNRNRRYCNPFTCGTVRRSKKYLEQLQDDDMSMRLEQRLAICL